MTQRSTRRTRVFSILTVLFSVIFSLGFAEWVLSKQQSAIQNSDNLQQGMILFDSRLGWRLSPGWQGQHSHNDFDVTYRINASGFRGTDNSNSSQRRVFILGDSFTFGFGVNNQDTFTEVLNRNFTPQDIRFQNLGVPGYSTDQELLYLKQKLQFENPENIILVVYLGNDIVDNLRSIPFQAEFEKPFYELKDNQLNLKNYPVRLKKPSKQPGNLTQWLLPPEVKHTGGIIDRFYSTAIVRRTGLKQSDIKIENDWWDERFKLALPLFSAMLSEFQKVSTDNNAQFTIALLGGRSTIEEPGSYSAQFQLYLRDAILDICQDKNINVLDLYPALKQAFDTGESLYFHNDGHLTVSGHQVLAEEIKNFILQRR